MFRFWSDTEDDLCSGSGWIQRMICVQVLVGYRGDLCLGSGRIQRMICVQVLVGYK